ncbi:MAG: hypothetical protein H6818_00300 [Phycisphaerales bacterium]|nr:hypothetical protein [Phycisphaerales bacterium]MCB9864963.1 hypothetical protein [Phycisphaerales bacterium]
MTRNLCSAIVALVALCGATVVSAQPTYINLGRISGGDISADGNAVVGSLLDSSIDEGLVTVWHRGDSVEFLPGGFAEGTIFASSDLSALAMQKGNLDDWGDLNCFLGNEVAPQNPPCSIRNISHRWTLGTGWVNCGSFPRSQVTVDYSCNGAPLAPVNVWIGGTRCDFTINSPNDISGDGRYVVGGGYLANSNPRTNGCAPSGICGFFSAFQYDSDTDTFSMLPAQPGSTSTRADHTNGDGSLVIGYDNGMTPDPDGAGPLTAYTGRRLTVWRNGVSTILDPFGNQDGAPSTADGTQVVGQISAQLAELELGPNPDPGGNPAYITWAKWTFNGVSWDVTELGRPDDITVNGVYKPLRNLYALAVSADGNTVVGQGTFNEGPFFSTAVNRAIIWRPTINGGKPMLVSDYVASQLPMGDTSFDNITLYTARQISADGGTLLLDIFDDSSPCLGTFADAIIDLDGAPCEAPQLNLPLVSKVQTTASSFGAVTNCFVSGTGPLQYQWQRKDLATATWVDIADDNCVSTPFLYKGSESSQLRIGLFDCDQGTGDYRCVVTNPCGSVTSNEIHITISPDALQFFCFLPGDMNNDISVDINDIPNFVASILCKPFPDAANPADRADVNLDGVKDGRDVQEFVQLLVP